MTTIGISRLKRFTGSGIVQRLMRGSLWSILGSVTSRLIMLATMVILARILGIAKFGELGLIQATLGVAGLMAGVGLGSTATRFVAMHAKSDATRAGRVVALVALSSIVAVIAVAVSLIALSGPISRWFLDAPHLRGALVWGAVLMAALAFRGVQNGILAGLEKFDVLAKLNILDAVVSFGGALVLAKLMGVQGVLLAFACGAAAAFLMGLVFVTDELRSSHIELDVRRCWREWRILTGYSAPSFLANLIATPVLWLSMTLVARSQAGYSEIGLYNAAYQWHGPMIFLPLTLASVSIPILVQEWEAGTRVRFRRIAFSLLGLVLATSLPLVIILSVFNREVMALYGDAFIDGRLILVLLLAAAPLHGASKVASAALLAMKRPWWVLWINFAWSATLLSVTVWLLPDFGVLGLAVAFVTAYGLLCVLSFSLVWIGSQNVAAKASQWSSINNL